MVLMYCLSSVLCLYLRAFQWAAFQFSHDMILYAIIVYYKVTACQLERILYCMA